MLLASNKTLLLVFIYRKHEKYVGCLTIMLNNIIVMLKGMA